MGYSIFYKNKTWLLAPQYHRPQSKLRLALSNSWCCSAWVGRCTIFGCGKNNAGAVILQYCSVGVYALMFTFCVRVSWIFSCFFSITKSVLNQDNLCLISHGCRRWMSMGGIRSTLISSSTSMPVVSGAEVSSYHMVVHLLPAVDSRDVHIFHPTFQNLRYYHKWLNSEVLWQILVLWHHCYYIL